MMPSLTTYDLPFPQKWGFHMPPTYANDHMSATATGDPIHLMFGSRVWFSGTADWTALFTIRTNPSHRHLGKISSGDISATGRPIHFMFCSRVGFSLTTDLMALFSNKSKMAAAAILEKFQMAISPQPVVRSTSCLVIEWGFGGRRI